VNEADYLPKLTDLFAGRVTQFEQTYLPRRKGSTVRTIQYFIRKYLLPKWSQTPVAHITAETVNEWIGALTHLSPSSVRHLIQALQLIIGSRFEKKAIHFPSYIEEQSETACYSQDQVERILAAAKGQYRVLFAAAAGTGMRAGELYGLKVEDIDFSRPVIHVRRSAWEGELQSPKTRNARRAISVTKSMTDMLEDHLHGRTTGLVFPSRAYNGQQRPLRNSNVLKRGLRPYIREARHSDGWDARFSSLSSDGTNGEQCAARNDQGMDRSWIGSDDSPLFTSSTRLLRASSSSCAGCNCPQKPPGKRGAGSVGC
jgi:integrase